MDRVAAGGAFEKFHPSHPQAEVENRRPEKSGPGSKEKATAAFQVTVPRR
jgi:hypothetical protein